MDGFVCHASAFGVCLKAAGIQKCFKWAVTCSDWVFGRVSSVF